MLTTFEAIYLGIDTAVVKLNLSLKLDHQTKRKICKIFVTSKNQLLIENR